MLNGRESWWRRVPLRAGRRFAGVFGPQYAVPYVSDLSASDRRRDFSRGQMAQVSGCTLQCTHASRPVKGGISMDDRKEGVQAA